MTVRKKPNMIQLKSNELVFAFPEVHEDARLSIDFQRTLRIPDDGTDYPLPPGLGSFPLAHVDDHADRVPPTWLTHGGVMLPMYQSEAMWLSFNSRQVSDRDTEYPFAVKIATGKVCAVSGETWRNDLARKPRQNYLAIPRQPWLDGYCVEEGIIRQFVAMPLGAGYTAEEQITGEAEHGGLQVLVAPMKREVFERRFPKIRQEHFHDDRFRYSMELPCACRPDMGLAPGGRMRQKIYRDPFDLADYDTDLAQPLLRPHRQLHGLADHHRLPSPNRAADRRRLHPPRPAVVRVLRRRREALSGIPEFSALSNQWLASARKRATSLSRRTPPSTPPTSRLIRKGLGPDQVREGRF